jgi:hypothetical protein
MPKLTFKGKDGKKVDMKFKPVKKNPSKTKGSRYA